MGSMEEHLGNIVIERGRDLWKSPRGTVLRIEALALVAIALSFFLAFFGSCRRWSNRWIVQKGYLVAQVLSLSLGTYSIGLMQSSPVKSGMYPIWAVSLFTLFGCVDPITTYIVHDYKGPLSKMIFQLCLYFGYVMLMSMSTISNCVGKLAIVLLSTITFMKGFHRALAFVLALARQTLEDRKESLEAIHAGFFADADNKLLVHSTRVTEYVTMADVQKLRLPEGTTANGLSIKDVCLAYSFSHELRKHFLSRKMGKNLFAIERAVWKIGYKQALNVVEVELAFLFEAFYSSNEFLHLYQAKTGSFWALASFVGICFVGVVAAIIPGAMASHDSIINSAAAATGSHGAGTSVGVNIVSTTTADLIVTLVILVSLALVQLVQLMRCLTSNWARVGIAYDYAICEKRKKMALDEVKSVKEVTTGDGSNDDPQRHYNKEECCSCFNTRSSSNNQVFSRWLMGLRLFLVDRVNYFDKYLWKASIGQDSMAAFLQRKRTRLSRGPVLSKAFCCCLWFDGVGGMEYVCEVVAALLLSDTTNPGGAVDLHDDVKASITEFLGTVTRGRIGVEWSDLFVKNGLQDWLKYLPYINMYVYVPEAGLKGGQSEAYAFTWRVMIWHIATWYCEEADKAAKEEEEEEEEEEEKANSISREKNRRVALDLSKYCTYLVVSAPELLPGPAAETKSALKTARSATDDVFPWAYRSTLEAMQQGLLGSGSRKYEFMAGVHLGKRLRNEAMTTPPTGPCLPWKVWEESTGRRCSSDHWELLALVWVQTLLYAAPYGDKQAHMQHLPQGGEFITHLWALLFHLGIDKWEVADIDELKRGAAAAAPAETTTEVQVQEDAVGELKGGAAAEPETTTEVQVQEDAVSRDDDSSSSREIQVTN